MLVLACGAGERQGCPSTALEPNLRWRAAVKPRSGAPQAQGLRATYHR